jgi:hypothetical protein
MLHQPFLLVRARVYLLVAALGIFFPAASRAQLVVDCTGVTPGAFPSINAALGTSGPGSAIFVVAGPCNENLNLAGQLDLFIGTYYGFPNVALNGSINVGQSHGVYFHGLDISTGTSGSGNGISVSQSQALIIQECNLNGNAGFGLSLSGGSEALIVSPASFDNNNAGGIYVSENSTVETSGWNSQPVDISNNRGPGVFVSFGSFNTYGRTTILNNVAGLGSLSGYGVDMRGGSRAQFGALSGSNVISGNQSGGVSLQEGAEISFWNGGWQTLIQNNGPVGISAGFHSQVTLFNDAEISGHAGPALDLYASSQAYLFDGNNLHNNGVAGDARSAAIRLDGNSEALLRGGTVSQNLGPGILALVNSSVDVTGVSFSSNSGGLVVCDSSAFMVSDLVAGTLMAPGVGCRTPHSLGNRHVNKLQPEAPDWAGLKALVARTMARATKH